LTAPGPLVKGKNAMNRRYFLMGTAAAAGALGPRGLASPNDTIRMGVVGLRGRGGSHVRGWASQPNVEIVAMCDVDQAPLAARMKDLENFDKKAPATYTDVRKLLEDKSIDAVSIATPNHWHTLISVWACQAGKDVYVEKPCSHSVFESQQIVAAAKKYNRLVQQGNQLRSSPAVREGIQHLREGLIGDVYMARGVVFGSRPTIGKASVEAVPAGVDYDLWTGPAPKREFTKNRFHYNWHWFWDTGNGEIGNQGPHELDLCRWGLGVTYPTKVSAVGGKFMWDDDQETPNTLTATWEFENGGKKQMIVMDVRPWFSNDEAGIKGPMNFNSGEEVMPSRLPGRSGAANGQSRGGPVRTFGNEFFGPKGYMVVTGYEKYKTFLGPNEEPGPHAQEEGNHWANFIGALRSRKESDLTSPITEGATSCILVHLANISYRLGRSLTFDAKTMSCVGDQEANRMFKRDYRKPFVVPEKV
jgi:predicted dehydrogenase